jgi:hypothetical protein
MIGLNRMVVTRRIFCAGTHPFSMEKLDIDASKQFDLLPSIAKKSALTDANVRIIMTKNGNRNVATTDAKISSYIPGYFTR